MNNTIEFFCPYCQLYINDTVHRQHHHNDPDQPDENRVDWYRVNGVEYNTEEAAIAAIPAPTLDMLPK